jgi:hypothetical protein
MIRTALSGALALLLLVLPALGRHQAPGQTQERWYVVELSGKRAGYMHSRRAPNEAGEIESTTVMAFEVRRGAAAVKINMETAWRETKQGKPVALVSKRAFGAAPVTTTYTFTPDGIVARTGDTENTIPNPEKPWLPPAAAERHAAERVKAGDKAFTVTTADESPMGGLTFHTATTTLVESEATVAVAGRTVPAKKWRATVDSQPGIESIVYTDEAGIPLRTEVDLGGIRMTMLAADKELALSKLDPPELLAATVVRPTGGKPNRKAEVNVYRLSVAEGELPDFPTTNAQKFERLDARTARLTVSRRPAPGNGPADAPADGDLGDSAMITSGDAKVKALAETATAKEGQAALAEALRRVVYKHVRKKNLDVGLGTAAEVARTGEGDCTEHAVLLAAMLRARGIPARVVTGLMYVEAFAGEKDIFGYHMWTQALIPATDNAPARWTDLDATLPADTPFDATHVAISVSALKPGDPEGSLAATVPLMGRLRIAVEPPAAGKP